MALMFQIYKIYKINLKDYSIIIRYFQKKLCIYIVFCTEVHRHTLVSSLLVQPGQLIFQEIAHSSLMAQEGDTKSM